MSESKNFGLKGIGDNVQLGKGGVRVKDNSGVLEAKNAADNAFVVLRAASPVNDDDVVTKRYLVTKADIIVSGQIDGNSPPAVVNGSVYICTTTGDSYTAKNYYHGESGSWVEYTPADGLKITVTTALSGGTITFNGDSIYEYDGNSSSWVLIGPSSSLNKVCKTERANLAYNTSSPLNIGSALSDSSRITKILVDVTQAFNGAAPTLSIGKSGSTSLLAAAAEIDLTAIGLYVIDCLYTTSGSEQMIATYVASSSSAGVATITMEYSVS